MTIREIVESKVREAAERYHAENSLLRPIRPLRDHIADAIIAILTDPQIGFKEALEYQSDAKTLDGEGSYDAIQSAEAKLKELEELK